MVTQVSSGGLTSVEQSLVEHVGRGEQFDLAADDEAVDEAAMRSWGESRTCRASVIRDILRGRLTADPDPHGLRLRGARITGRLDLGYLTTDVNLELKDCLLEVGVCAMGARLAGFSLAGCQIEHPAEPPLDAERLTCSVLILERARIIAHADGGAVRLAAAHIGGSLECDGAALRNDSGAALYADGLQVDQSMFLRDGFTATGSGDDSAVRMVGARIGGSLECDGAALRNDSGAALYADGLQVDRGMFLRGGFTATGSGGDGAVRLLGVRIGSQFDCTGAKLRNDSGPALSADNLQVGLDMYLDNGFTATSSSDIGAVRLLGASIRSLLSFTAAALSNDSGPALDADNLKVGLDMYLDGGFTATGSGDDGAVSLAGARIGRYLYCSGAKLSNDSGPALGAADLQVGLDMYLTRQFTATGSGDDGAVSLVGARIGGQLSCNEAVLGNDSGPALSAFSLQVGQGMYLDGLTAIGGGEGAVVDLTGARVIGEFWLDPTQLKHEGGSHWWFAVDGLSYAGVPETGPDWYWLDLLRHGTPYYAAQPYQYLAAGYRALGDDREAREILMRQRDDQLARTHPGWRERWWGRITKITLGYGYKPWRALLFLAAVVAVSCVLAVVLGSHGALAQTSKTATPGRPCTWVQQVSVGLDLNLPVGTSVARAGCDLTTDSASATAAWLTTIGWVLRLLAWAFAALFIAGFTSAVRKA